MSFDPLLASVGLAVGTLVGLSGMGGAALMAPILIFLGFRPLSVVGTDLAYSVVTKLVGSAHHLRYGVVDFPTVRLLAYGSLPGAAIGLLILTRIGPKAIDSFITRALGYTLVLVAATMLVRVLSPKTRVVPLPRWGLSALGFVVGLLVSITSVGSGSLIVAVLAMTTTLSSRAIVGTDLVHAFLLVTIATLGHWQAGSIDFVLSVNLLIGAVPGVLMGSRLSTSLSESVLRPTLAVVLLATGLRMI